MTDSAGGSAIAQRREDLVVLREAMFAPAFVPHDLAVHLHEEIAAATGHLVDVYVRAGAPDRGGQTDRLRQVVSNDAVLDRHVHGGESRPRGPGAKAADRRRAEEMGPHVVVAPCGPALRARPVAFGPRSGRKWSRPRTWTRWARLRRPRGLIGGADLRHRDRVVPRTTSAIQPRRNAPPPTGVTKTSGCRPVNTKA